MNYTILNPKGIDIPIQKLQTLLFEKLTWNKNNLDVFGRVFRNQSEQKGLVIEAFIGRKEYKDVFTNDSKTASIFFIEDDVHETKEGVKFSNKLKIVIMVNLEKAYPNILHRADMEAEIEAIELLQNKAYFSIEKVEKGIKQVLSEFNTDSIKLSDMQPYHVFSISGTVTYQLGCLTN